MVANIRFGATQILFRHRFSLPGTGPSRTTPYDTLLPLANGSYLAINLARLISPTNPKRIERFPESVRSLMATD
jgi:hypothetical protein